MIIDTSPNSLEKKISETGGCEVLEIEIRAAENKLKESDLYEDALELLARLWSCRN